MSEPIDAAWAMLKQEGGGMAIAMPTGGGGGPMLMQTLGGRGRPKFNVKGGVEGIRQRARGAAQGKLALKKPEMQQTAGIMTPHQQRVASYAGKKKISPQQAEQKLVSRDARAEKIGRGLNWVAGALGAAGAMQDAQMSGSLSNVAQAGLGGFQTGQQIVEALPLGKIQEGAQQRLQDFAADEGAKATQTAMQEHQNQLAMRQQAANQKALEAKILADEGAQEPTLVGGGQVGGQTAPAPAPTTTTAPAALPSQPSVVTTAPTGGPVGTANLTGMPAIPGQPPNPQADAAENAQEQALLMQQQQEQQQEQQEQQKKKEQPWEALLDESGNLPPTGGN